MFVFREELVMVLGGLVFMWELVLVRTGSDILWVRTGVGVNGNVEFVVKFNC